MIINWIKTLLSYKVNYKNDRVKKDFESINFSLLKTVSDRKGYESGAIDDTTWHDLEMDKVFDQLNHTYTLSGEETLYQWLRRPTLCKKTYDNRRQRIEDVLKKKHHYTDDLSKIGPFDYDYRQVLNEINSTTSIDRKPIYMMLTVVSMLVLFMLFKSSIFVFIACGGILGIILYHYFYMANNKYLIACLDYLVRMSIFTLKQKQVIEDIYQDDLENLFILASKMARYKNTFSRLEGLDPLKDIGVALTLQNYISSVSAKNHLYANKDQATRMIKIIGELDVIQALNQIKCNLSQPQLSDDNKTLKIKDAYNILVDDCVKNDVSIDQSIVITGSNMGGKSTYLRQVGISIILAQSLCLSPSSKHEGGFYSVMSSISLNDDINDGKSYFMKEAEAIQRMIQSEVNSYNTLFLIDEIFKGTNPIERLASSVEILNILSEKEQVIVTTHDIGILPFLKEYEFFHFEHNISKSRMAFDYKLKKGVTEVRNAIKLMEYINYPTELIDSINNRMIQMNEIV